MCDFLPPTGVSITVALYDSYNRAVRYLVSERRLMACHSQSGFGIGTPSESSMQVAPGTLMDEKE